MKYSDPFILIVLLTISKVISSQCRFPLAFRKIITRIRRSEVKISLSYIIFRREKQRISLQP